MVYRITKDCGTGWDDWRRSVGLPWGVSERQRALAQNVRAGDVFLHYIDRVHAWACYSFVASGLQKNDRDSHPDWANALPSVIPIERGVWLTEAQCEQTVDIRGLSDKPYERQVAFSAVLKTDDTKLIMAAIDSAAAVSGQQPSPEFHARWLEGAEGYYKRIVKDLANGKCRLCGEDATSWAGKRVGVIIRDEDTARIINGFLDAAHIVPDCALGAMTPDNLRALCPNCHRVIDRLPQQERETRLRKI